MTLPATRRMRRAAPARKIACTEVACTLPRIERRRRAVAQQLVEEELGHLARVTLVREGALRGEGVVLQPLEQAAPVRGDDVGLDEVDVGVDEARQDQLARVVEHGQVARRVAQQRARVAELANIAAIDDQEAVLVVLVRAGIACCRDRP